MKCMFAQPDNAFSHEVTKVDFMWEQIHIVCKKKVELEYLIM